MDPPLSSGLSLSLKLFELHLLNRDDNTFSILASVTDDQWGNWCDGNMYKLKHYLNVRYTNSYYCHILYLIK